VSRLYLDACTIIYLIEGAPEVQSLVVRRMTEHGSSPSSPRRQAQRRSGTLPGAGALAGNQPPARPASRTQIVSRR
jgi:hypothetical protein